MIAESITSAWSTSSTYSLFIFSNTSPKRSIFSYKLFFENTNVLEKFKIKIGYDLNDDISSLASIEKILSDSEDYMIDVNQAWKVDKVNSNILIIMLKFLEIVDTAKNRTFIKKTLKYSRAN